MVSVEYPYDTEFGRSISIPYEFAEHSSLSISDTERVIGESLKVEEITSLLDSYGHWVMREGDVILVTPPPYRDDIMHPVDLCEDIAISRGYGNFKPVMPSQMTVGALSEIEKFSDRIRGYMVGAGFQEIISNILKSKEDNKYKMGVEDEKVIEVDNTMSQSYSVLRHWILPSLLRSESASSESFYPHRIFEAGETAVYDETENLSARTAIQCAALISHHTANFSEVHSILDTLMYYLQIG